ncbi:hypothetical protein AQJ30_19705 [Streptomyces longwoodensis]|uniref:SCO1431 family membrane protein n=1 Tax=Streptomyces longwoodensis TaxID=68231 RepID=A0A101QVD5_9ACTN|nr:hypothetical protein AQJ30_19705 [Streptomyces longwoodensis]
MSNLSAANGADGGKVDGSTGRRTRPVGLDRGASTRPAPTARPPQRDTMTAHSATARAHARTGGPKDDGPRILEHVAGWTLVVVVAMLMTQLGLL